MKRGKFQVNCTWYNGCFTAAAEWEIMLYFYGKHTWKWHTRDWVINATVVKMDSLECTPNRGRYFLFFKEKNNRMNFTGGRERQRAIVTAGSRYPHGGIPPKSTFGSRLAFYSTALPVEAPGARVLPPPRKAKEKQTQTQTQQQHQPFIGSLSDEDDGEEDDDKDDDDDDDKDGGDDGEFVVDPREWNDDEDDEYASLVERDIADLNLSFFVPLPNNNSSNSNGNRCKCNDNDCCCNNGDGVECVTNEAWGKEEKQEEKKEKKRKREE